MVLPIRKFFVFFCVGDLPSCFCFYRGGNGKQVLCKCGLVCFFSKRGRRSPERKPVKVFLGLQGILSSPLFVQRVGLHLLLTKHICILDFCFHQNEIKLKLHTSFFKQRKRQGIYSLMCWRLSLL